MLVHIVPHLPPRTSGVGDASLVLGKRVEEASGGDVVSSYVAAGWDASRPLSAVSALDVTGRQDARALVEALAKHAPDSIILHYVGYGYARRGAPWWLLDALRQARRAYPAVRLVTMFHELYATGLPWQSSFWTSPMQRWIGAELARLSDAAFTNRHASADWLHRHAPRTPVEVCPSPSNVGEPETVRTWAEREPVAVVFGGRGQRGAVYACPSDTVRGLLDRAGIERVWDIGPSADTPGIYAGRPVDVFGALPASDVSARLQEARLGLIHYDPAFMTKSGIAAAYLSHAVPVRTLSQDARPAGPHAPPCVRTYDVEVDFERISRSGFDWYHTHAHSTSAARRVAAACGWSPAEALPVKREGAGVMLYSATR